MPMTKQKLLYAIKLAYRIVTDKRNTNRYLGTFLTNDNGNSITYPEMIDGLEAIYKEIDSYVPIKHAKWIPHRPGDVHACSNCGFGVLPSNWFMNGRCFGPVIWHNKFNFCPYCGAKMVNAKMDGDPGEDT